jgi:hypothetical protein
MNILIELICLTYMVRNGDNRDIGYIGELIDDIILGIYVLL